MPSSLLAPGLAGVACTATGGHAVRAQRRFAAGSVLAVWGGEIVTLSELELRPPEIRRLTLQVDDDAFLVSTEEGPADWINHSCEPNAGLSGQITLVAARVIRAGEEVTFDYAMSDGCAYDEFDCRCGAPSCRGRITGQDWKLPHLIDRYTGLRSPYLQRRIDRLEAKRARPFDPVYHRTNAEIGHA